MNHALDGAGDLVHALVTLLTPFDGSKGLFIHTWDAPLGPSWAMLSIVEPCVRRVFSGQKEGAAAQATKTLKLVKLKAAVDCGQQRWDQSACP